MASAEEARPLPRVAVLGAGAMGQGMTHSLIRNGFRVGVWDRTPGKAAALAADGATAHEDARDAVREDEVVITMLADADAVNQVAFGGGMLEAMQPQAVWAQMGTIGVTATEELAARVSKERPDVYFVDAPVSGTRQPAENGQLLILASGPEQAKPVLEPVFAALGRETKWLGGAGAGSRLKLLMNSWLVFLVEGAAEIMALADSLGVDHQQVLDFLSSGNLANPAAAAKFAKMDAGDDSPDFALQWALKDIRLAMEASGRRLPMLEVIGERWAALVSQGLGDRDVSAARHGLG
ncbi:MAG: NAD(P)-dependent oxidoreductase [Streptosporangiaceae bacterium]